MTGIYELQELKNEFYEVVRVWNLSGLETQDQLAFPIDGPRCDGYLFRVTPADGASKIHLFAAGYGGTCALFEMPDKRQFGLLVSGKAYIVLPGDPSANIVLEDIQDFRLNPAGSSLVITDFSNIHIWNNNSSYFRVSDKDGHCFIIDSIDDTTVACTSDDCYNGAISLVINLKSGHVLSRKEP